MARTVLVMRHANSEWNSVAADHDRALTWRGKRDAQRMGEELLARGLVPDAIVSSTAQRAQSTAQRVAQAAGFEGEITLHPGLYLAGLGPMYQVLASLDPTVQRVLVVGHNPIAGDLVYRLTGELVAMPTAALACVELPIDHWSEVNGSTAGDLRLYVTPRELR